MVSASAILAGGVNARYIAVSDRVRALAHEYRDPQTNDARRKLICGQMTVFNRRVHLVSWAIRMCYVSMACFILMALVITATAFRQMLVAVTLPLFLVGIGFILTAIVFQLMELQAANNTIAMEMNDILGNRRVN